MRIHLAGRPAPVILGLRDCEVFSAVYDGEKIVDWKSVLVRNVPNYPKFLTGCLKQELRFDGHTVTAVLQRLPLGAGGGSLYTYTSRDGVHWTSD